MCLRLVVILLVTLCLYSAAPLPVSAAENASVLEQSMSETLDVWREGRYEQLFDRLAHRGKTSREAFVRKMQNSAVRPACCFQKMQNFKVLNEKRTEATVYLTLGLEGPPNSAETSTREFKLTHEGGMWRMQLNDVVSIAGAAGKKSVHAAKNKKRHGQPH